ncbi:MAG: hypothetical protein U0V18_10540 [Anaerolineales bacterium]
MFLEISEHLFDPHPSTVVVQGQSSIGKAGRQSTKLPTSSFIEPQSGITI